MTTEHCASARRDPHGDWWLAFRKLGYEVENYELLTGLPGDDDDAVYMGKMEELNALCDKILTTRARTFEAARLQYKMVVQELGVDKDTAGEKGLLLLRGFVLDVERALKRRGRLAEVEAELREHMAPPTAG